MTSATKIEVICPCCTAWFTAPILISTNSLGGQTTEFQPRAIGDEPLQFVLGSCPNCGFTDYTDRIQQGVLISESTCTRIFEEITPQIQRYRLDVATQFALMAQIAIWEDQPASLIGDYFLQAAWCSRGSMQPIPYRRLACRYYEQAIEGDPLSDTTYLTYLYLIGEIYRRLKKPQIAGLWFDRAIAYAKLQHNTYADQLAALARDQRDHPRDMI